MSVVTASPKRLPLHRLVGSNNYMMVSKTYMTTFSLWVIMLSSLAHVPIELSCPVWNSHLATFTDLQCFQLGPFAA